MNSVWIVDDDQSIRWVLERALRREGFSVRSFENPQDCLNALSTDRPLVLVSDIRMPGGNGIDMLRTVKEAHPELPVIIMTAYSDLGSAVTAFQNGAFEYLAKPFDLSNAVELIRRAVEERGTASQEPVESDNGFGILGQAPAMQDVFRAIGRLSQSPVTVLVTGESGSGKELVARALHRHSKRSDKPFVALNMAAIPHELLESELFGHERGAFTGAQQQRRGRFEQAEGGTLFLDEIGDMPAALQTRLLRVLSDGNFYRVGGTQSIRADVRVIAATHQALEEQVRRGEFREDLFHRLNVIRLRVPALRERREDIGLLARHFLRQCAAETATEPKQIDELALAKLAAFDWPGNVRQLDNCCRWLTVMAPTQRIGVGDLPPEVLQGSSTSPTPLVSATTSAMGSPAAASEAFGPARGGSPALDDGEWSAALYRKVEAMLSAQPRPWPRDAESDLMSQLSREFETAVLTAALRFTGGRRIDASLRLGIGRNTITRKVQELGLDE